MTEIAWTRNDIPAQLKALPEDLHLWAKGLYNAFVLSDGDGDPVDQSLERMEQTTGRELEQVKQRLDEVSTNLQDVRRAAGSAPAAAIEGLELSLARLEATRDDLERRLGTLAEAQKEVSS